MTFYRYATTMRPAGLGAVPREGLIYCRDFDATLPSGHYGYSIVLYERQLTEKEISDYELEFLGESP